MPPIQRLLQRWGFVKLGRYGLELTADGRISSLRQAVLDDGTGNRIVGWQDTDPAISELTAWQLSESSRAAEHARAVAATAMASPVAAVAPVVPVGSPPTSAAPVAEMADAVAPEAAVDEDEWEWTIALAKARAAAESTEVGAPSEHVPRHAQPASPAMAAMDTRPLEAAVPANTRPLEAAVPANTRPLEAAVPANTRPPAAATTAAPRQTPTMAQRVVKIPTVTLPESAMQAAPDPVALAPRGAAPTTVIPVPPLPTIETMHGKLAPVVRTIPPRTGPRVPPASMVRFATGTGPVEPESETATPAAADAAAARQAAVPGRKGSPVKTGELPLAARVVALPSLRSRVRR